MEFTNLEQTMDMIGDLVRSQYKARLKQGGHISTGKLYNSIDYRLVITENGIKLYFIALDYYIFIENGRKSGKMPPISDIKKWMTSKGLNDNKKAYAIARNIAKKGIKPSPYLREIKSKLPSFYDDIQTAIEKDITIEMEKIKQNFKLKYGNSNNQ